MDGRSNYIEELTYFNAVACLLVILIHVLSLGISSVSPNAWQAVVIYLPWRFAAFVVPAFLFCGAVKMAGQAQDRVDFRSYRRFLISRICKIYVPYLIWNVIYYLAFLPIHYVNGTWRELLSYLLTGSLSAPFYYVILVMQFYMLQPLWVWMVNRIPWYLSVCGAILITFFSQRLTEVLGLAGLEFAYADRIFTSYLVFWVLGLYVGRYYDAVQSSVMKHQRAVFGSGIFVLGYVLLSYIQYAYPVFVFQMDYVKVFADCLSIAILLALSIVIRQSGLRLKKGLEFVHAASFFVFLSHCLFLTLGTAYLQGVGVGSLSVLLWFRFLICYTVPFLLYILWEKIKATLFGTKKGAVAK